MWESHAEGSPDSWNIGGAKPPVINDRTGDLDLEATGGVTVSHVVSIDMELRAPVLPLERQILQETELTTPADADSERTGQKDVMIPSLSY